MPKFKRVRVSRTIRKKWLDFFSTLKPAKQACDVQPMEEAGKALGQVYEFVKNSERHEERKP